jgi:hypothetical protein
LLLGAGFADVEIDTVSFDLPVESADGLITALAEGTVRTGALLRAADDGQRRQIRASLEARLEPWRRRDGYAIAAAVKIASGTSSTGQLG